eukprot:Rhum_TRINITY_DN14178_c0_g1::Rhum_TRINITY_DN14178_c0_g1_i9::g.70644::m.70644
MSAANLQSQRWIAGAVRRFAAGGSKPPAAAAVAGDSEAHASSILCLTPLMRQRRFYSTTPDGGDKSSVWKTMERRSRVEDEDEANEEVPEEMVPKTFREFLQYCKIINSVNMPALLMKEGLPNTNGVMEALQDLSMLNLITDEGFYYLVIVGWQGEMAAHKFRVFESAEREKVWKEMMRWVSQLEGQLGPKSYAALMQVASAAGRTDDCLDRYRESIENGNITRFSVASVLYALGRSRKQSALDSAQTVFQFCKEHSFRREEYKAFIYANARKGNWRDARYHFEAYKKHFPTVDKRGVKSAEDLKVLSTLLTAYSRGRNSTGAEEVFSEITQRFETSNLLVSSLISSYANGSVKGYNKARMLFLRSYDVTYTSSANAWMKVMVGLIRSLRRITEPHDDAVEEKIQKSKGIENSPWGSSVLASKRRAKQRSAFLIQRFWKLYQVMESFPSHYKPDAVTFYHALQFARETKDVAQATKVLQDAEEAGLKHTTYYNLAISAYARNADVRGVMQLFKEMRKPPAKLLPDINTFAAIIESITPGQGTNNAKAVLDNMEKSEMKMNSAFLAGCARAFSNTAGVPHLAEVMRTGIDLSSGDCETDYVLDSPWLWKNLEGAFDTDEMVNLFHAEYPDFSERVFELVAGPIQQLRAPRPCTHNMDDFKQHFTVASGKTMWVITDEWMLPLGDKLKEYIQDVLDAKDKIVIPFYCLMRLGKIVRRGTGNNLLREAAFKVITVLQELFDESAEQSARGEEPTVDTIYFREQLWCNSRTDFVLAKTPHSEKDEERDRLLHQTPIVYDLEFTSSAPIQEDFTMKMMSRRSLIYASFLQGFQMQGRSQLYFLARDAGHLAMAKELGLEAYSVEDVLGEGWLKKRHEEEEKLMLSWRAPDTTLAIDEPAQAVPALTATSFEENEYEQSLLREVELEDERERDAKRAKKQEEKERAKELASFEANKASSDADAAELQKQAAAAAAAESPRTQPTPVAHHHAATPASHTTPKEEEGDVKWATWGKMVPEKETPTGWFAQAPVRGRSADPTAVETSVRATSAEAPAGSAAMPEDTEVELPEKKKKKKKKKSKGLEVEVAKFTPEPSDKPDAAPAAAWFSQAPVRGRSAGIAPDDVAVGSPAKVAEEPAATTAAAGNAPVDWFSQAPVRGRSTGVAPTASVADEVRIEEPAAATPAVDAPAEDGSAPSASATAAEGGAKKKSAWGSLKAKKKKDAAPEDEVANFTPDKPATSAEEPASTAESAAEETAAATPEDVAEETSEPAPLEVE